MCVERQESVFSVTGFLTFVVVTATAVSNVIANIDNNNNNNNNNDNNDNVNNNNQISDSNDAMNMGNARSISIKSKVCLQKLICQSVLDIGRNNFTEASNQAALVGCCEVHFRGNIFLGLYRCTCLHYHSIRFY